jgi:hypothetical protein
MPSLLLFPYFFILSFLRLNCNAISKPLGVTTISLKPSNKTVQCIRTFDHKKILSYYWKKDAWASGRVIKASCEKVLW